MERTVVPIDWPVKPWPVYPILCAIIFTAFAVFAAATPFMHRASGNISLRDASFVALITGGLAVMNIRKVWKIRSQFGDQANRGAHTGPDLDVLSASIEDYLRRRRAYDPMGLLSRRRVSWDSLCAHLCQAGLAPPRTVVDRRAGERYHSDEGVPGYFVEAEEIPILGMDQALALLGLVLIIAVLGAGALGWWSQMNTWMNAGLVVVLGMMAGMILTAFRSFVVSTGRGLGRPLAVLASPGVLDDQRGKKWVAGEATMFVCMNGAQVQVVVLGPAGWLSFTFNGTSGGDFIALWQRWNHPHPRPELV